MEMSRTEAADYVKSHFYEYLSPAGKIGRKQSYICPICGNGSGKDRTGIVIDPKAENPYTLHCFVCETHGSIVDFYMKEHNVDTGEAFRGLYKHFDITINENRTETPQKTQNEPQKVNIPPTDITPVTGRTEAIEQKIDFSGYYAACRERLEDAAAIKYLSLRGISKETALLCGVGYDPMSDPASAPGAMGNEYKPHPCPRIIVPFDRSHYMGRRIDGRTDFKALNSKQHDDSDTAPPFNLKALYDDSARPVFVTEGAFDAMSVIEAGGLAISLNSTANRHRLIETLREKKTLSKLILCLDTDDAGKKATEELSKELTALNIPFNIAKICGNGKDPNEALIADRENFIAKVTAAMNNETETPCQCQLTAERAISILESEDDRYISMPKFSQLSQTLKLKSHDTVILSADTGAGKSSLALNFLHELSKEYPSMFFNLEMDEATVIQRLVSIHSRTDLDDIEQYKTDAKVRNKVDAAIQEITAGKTIQLFESEYDIAEIEQHIQIATEHRKTTTAVFIDHGLLVTTADRHLSRYERFTAVSENLRRIARTYNVIMFVILQQSRDGKASKTEKPTNGSLKESGSWENDATKIMFLWKNPQTKQKELVITKNRSGAMKDIPLKYHQSCQYYSE